MINRRGWLVIAIWTAFAMSAALAKSEPRLPLGYTCEDVRASIQRYGKLVAKALAYANGATKEQVREAEKCLAQ